MFDLIIRGGAVYDGTGRPARWADVAVSGGKIAAVEPLPQAQAARVIDARGKWVTPGFIDIHRHADAAAFRPGFGELELRQGLTTIVNGNCGLSCAPVGPENLPAILSYLEPICGRVPPEAAQETLAGYFAAQPAVPLHTGMLAGAGTIRASVAGYQVQRLEPAHYAAIHRRLEGALADGALGVSLGLGYAPECFYTTHELIRVLAPLAGQSIPITVHMRQEGGGVVEAAREMVEVARALKAPVHISHLKAMGRDNWNRKIPQVLALLDRARQEGLDLSCDVYPYTAGSTQLLHILPPEFLAGGMEAIVRRLQDPDQRKLLARRIESGDGFDDIAKLAGWDGIFLTSLHCPEDHPYQGMSLQQIAELTGQDPLTCCCDLLVREQGEITMIDFMAHEEDIAAILRDPFSNLISDSTYPTEGQPHPRVYGTFVHLLTRFVRERGDLTPEAAIHKMTGRPAAVLGMRDRGVLTPGPRRISTCSPRRTCGSRGRIRTPAAWRRGWTPCWWPDSRSSTAANTPASWPGRSSEGAKYAGADHRHCAPGGGHRPLRPRHSERHPGEARPGGPGDPI